MTRTRFIKTASAFVAACFALPLFSVRGQDRKRIKGLQLVRIDGTIEQITSETPNGNWLFGAGGRKLVRVRTVSLEKLNNRHAHNYPHTTTCLVGQIDIHCPTQDGSGLRIVTLKKGESFDLPAFHEHEIRINPEYAALPGEDGKARFYCTFDHRNGIGDIVETPEDMEHAY